MAQPDPKYPRRVADSALLRALHQEWRECVICGEHRGKLSLHHVHKHPRDDVRGNLVMLCGTGTTGCHGKVEHADRDSRRALGWYLVQNRPDVLRYLATKLRGEVQARAWIQRTFYIEA